VHESSLAHRGDAPGEAWPACLSSVVEHPWGAASHLLSRPASDGHYPPPRSPCAVATWVASSCLLSPSAATIGLSQDNCTTIEGCLHPEDVPGRNRVWNQCRILPNSNCAQQQSLFARVTSHY
jgi:hypothetical protein